MPLTQSEPRGAFDSSDNDPKDIGDDCRSSQTLLRFLYSRQMVLISRSTSAFTFFFLECANSEPGFSRR